MNGCNMTKREPLQKPVLPQVNYMELLNEELASCCRPSIKDVSKASADDIMRDIYRVLSGDQDNVTGGLIVKVASANVNIGIVQQHLTSVTKAVNDQLDRCNEVQDKTEKKNFAEKVKVDTIRTALNFVWDNKTFIGGAILGLAVYLNTLTANQAVQSARDQRSATEDMVKLLDTKISAISKLQIANTHQTPIAAPPASRTP